MIEIDYYKKIVYGNTHMYIYEPVIAEAVSKLTGRKVLIPEHKKALETLGFSFHEVEPPRK